MDTNPKKVRTTSRRAMPGVSKGAMRRAARAPTLRPVSRTWSFPPKRSWRGSKNTPRAISKVRSCSSTWTTTSPRQVRGRAAGAALRTNALDKLSWRECRKERRMKADCRCVSSPRLHRVHRRGLAYAVSEQTIPREQAHSHATLP